MNTVIALNYWLPWCSKLSMQVVELYIMKIAQNIVLAVVLIYGFNVVLNQTFTIVVVKPAAAEVELIDYLLGHLDASNKTLKTAVADFQQQQQSGGMSAHDAIDFSDYLSQLRKQVGKDCAALAVAGYDTNQQLSCQGHKTVAKSSAAEQASEQTRDDKVAGQIKQLSQQLGEFDEMMLREQARVKAGTPPSDSAQSSGQSSARSGGASSSAQQQEDVLTAGDLASGKGEEKAVPRQRFPEPVDTPNGSDDDLVARQLRELAEQETDPVLRAKLWNEYKKYKQGI